MAKKIKNFVSLIIALSIMVLLSIIVAFEIGKLLDSEQYNCPVIEFQTFKKINEIFNINQLGQETGNRIFRPPLYIITPSYQRPDHLAELTRLGYTLKHVENLIWLVIEDAETKSPIITKILTRIGVPFVHLPGPTPEKYKKYKPQGVAVQNRGLLWIRKNAIRRANSNGEKGVVFFADVDNSYDISIFEQMRYTKKISMWPVGLMTKYGVSGPIVRKGKLIGFHNDWSDGRRFPVDMGGFAVSVEFLLSRPKAEMPFKPGYEEDGFLNSLTPFSKSEIQLIANNCTEILAWNTKPKNYKLPTLLSMAIKK